MDKTALPFVPSPDLLRAPLPTHISMEPFLALLKERAEISPQFIRRSDKCDSHRENSIEQKHSKGRQRKHPGRKISKENLFLRKFTRTNEMRKNQAPKLENIRYRMLRTLKKVIRRLSNSKPLKLKGLLQFCMSRTSTLFWSQQLENYVLAHRRAVLTFADVHNGPRVDQARPSTNTYYCTYNNPYMESVFAIPEVRVVYQLFVKLVFADKRPASLGRRFRARCCRTSNHDATCEGKWAEFRMMIEDYLGAKVAESGEDTLPGTPSPL